MKYKAPIDLKIRVSAKIHKALTLEAAKQKISVAALVDKIFTPKTAPKKPIRGNKG